MPFTIVRNDITKLQADAIVNAANSSLAPGGGVCGAIFAAAGYDDLKAACDRIGHCRVGRAVITPGFRLPAKYVIHAVGPIWRGGGKREAALLHSCYQSALALAVANDCESIAFPLISSGVYGYPKAEALRIAVNAIRAFLAGNDLSVTLVIFDRNSLVLSESLFSGIQSYIDDHYAERFSRRDRRQAEAAIHAAQLAEQDGWIPPLAQAMPAPAAAPGAKRTLEDAVRHLDDSFNQMLLRLIDEKGYTDTEVYKRANIDRKLFSKLRKEGYAPSKPTAIALAIALRLNLDETRDFLGRAGYALSHSSKFDVIIEYFISEGRYDIFEINEALFAFDQKLLGA